MEKSNRFQGIALSKSLPFWSWNDKLCDEKLSEQIEWMKAHNIGGFFMHARAGLKTPYLSKEWFDRIKFCIEKAKKEGMQAWAYDENGWPSGFAGGKLLEEQENLENFLEFSLGEYDENAFVSYDISGDNLVRVQKYTSGDNFLNVFKRRAVSSVDILDKKVVEKFIKLTHEEYKEKLGKDFDGLSGFFTDEPQFCGRGLVYPHVIEKEFKKLYGEDILDGIGLLFVKKDGYKKFRYRYYKLCQSLMLDSFAKQIYEWCDDNGVCLTGHYIEERGLFFQMLFNAGVMPFYEYEHIPAIDWLCKRYMSVVLARQLGSACAQLGKKEAMSETFAMAGWDASPKELKSIGEFQYFYGVNKTCQHLLPYSEYGERKNDHPVHFTPLNPWMNEGFGKFNGYFNKLGGILQTGKEFVNVAVLHTIRSAYLNYNYGDALSVKELDESFIGISDFLAKSGIGFHYLDETLLAKYGFVKNGQIGCGKCAYDYLIVPKCYTIDKTTEKLLHEFIASGGKILFTSDIPDTVEAEPYDLSYLKSNTTIDEIKQSQPYAFNCIFDNVYPAFYRFENFDLLLLLNIDNAVVAEGDFKVDGSIFEYDFTNDTETLTDNRFVLDPLSSKAIIIDRTYKEACVAPKKNIQEVIYPYSNLHVESSDDNCFLLDYARYSVDGVNFSEPTAIIGIFDQLLKKQYIGDLYLDFAFNVEALPSHAKLLSEYEKAEITLNGEQVVFGGEYFTEKQMRLGDITSLLKIGKNRLSIKLHFYQDEKVYYALFGEGVTESLRNCLVYDTYLESLRILGDFGVYSGSKIIRGFNKNVVFAQDFYIGAKKTVIQEMTTDGYPFFAGKITFKETIRIEDTDVRLRFWGKIHFANVFVNGKKAGELLFNDYLDVSEFAVKGDNTVVIEMFTGLRNFFGPHHHAVYDEVGGISPNTFMNTGSWENDTSIYERKSYSLVRQGLFKPNGQEWLQK